MAGYLSESELGWDLPKKLAPVLSNPRPHSPNKGTARERLSNWLLSLGYSVLELLESFSLAGAT
jgi:hypothetical protein